jgi:ATP-dependent Clp protease ATP-binding subunit ClpA
LNELAGKKNVKIIFNNASKEWLIAKGFDDKMGARPLAKVISNSIKMPLSKEILFGKLKNGGAVMVSVKDDKLEFDYLSSVVTNSSAATDQTSLTVDSGNVLPQEVGV